MTHKERIIDISLPVNQWEIPSNQTSQPIPRGQRVSMQNGGSQRRANAASHAQRHAGGYNAPRAGSFYNSGDSGSGKFLNGVTLSRVQPDLYEFVDDAQNSIEFEIAADGDESGMFASAGESFNGALNNEALMHSTSQTRFSQRHGKANVSQDADFPRVKTEMDAPGNLLMDFDTTDSINPPVTNRRTTKRTSTRRNVNNSELTNTSPARPATNRKRGSAVNADRTSASRRRTVNQSPNMDDSITAGISHNKLCRSVVDLPLARIKTIMKTSPEVQSVGMLPLVAVTKSAELFIERIARLALASAGRSGAAATQQQPNSGAEISYNNLARLVADHDELDFLSDVIPKKILASDWLSNYKQLYEDE